jgi:hypothetical protein
MLFQYLNRATAPKDDEQNHACQQQPSIKAGFQTRCMLLFFMFQIYYSLGSLND